MVLAAVILSVHLFVCLSVCHTRALWQNETTHCRYFDTTRKGNHSSFLTPTVVVRDAPCHLNFALTVTHPSKNADWQVSAYNLSTVRDSEKSSFMTNRKLITGFPVSYRWSAYFTPKSPKGWLRSDCFVFFWIQSISVEQSWLQNFFVWKLSATTL